MCRVMIMRKTPFDKFIFKGTPTSNTSCAAGAGAGAGAGAHSIALAPGKRKREREGREVHARTSVQVQAGGRRDDDSSDAKRAPQSGRGLVPKLGTKPLRLILVGHNPSEHAWRSGHYYSNPSNRMWKILKETNIAPSSIRGAEDDGKMVDAVGVGFIGE